MYGCPGCGSVMTFSVQDQALKCGSCGRTQSIEEADQREARTAGSSFSVDLLTCPTCGAEIRAMNTAQAAFCSYCGSSVMLERREADMEAPETVAPFRVTREECFQKYQQMVRKSLCADHRLKKQVTAESFRGIYVPHYIFSASVKGQTNLEATQTVGDDTYYYNTTVQLDHSFTHILHDASREMPDAMSEIVRDSSDDAAKFRQLCESVRQEGRCRLAYVLVDGTGISMFKRYLEGVKGKDGGEAGSRQLRVMSFCEYERSFWITKHSGAPGPAFRNVWRSTLYARLEREERSWMSISSSFSPSGWPG